MRAPNETTIWDQVRCQSVIWLLSAVCLLAWVGASFAQDPPVVSVSVEPALLNEETPGAAVVITFTVDGEIPTPAFDAEGNLVSGGLSILYDGFDTGLILDESTGFVFEGLILGPFFDTENFVVELILTQNVATATFPILNDVAQEADQTYNIGILPNDACLVDSLYTINPAASTGTVTFTDGNGGPGVGPTVGFNVTRRMLNEGDLFVVNFTVDGDMPAEGLTVLVDSPTPAALGEFSIFNEDGTPAIQVTGIDGFPEVGDTGASSFLVTLVEPTASMTVGVFNDGPNEGMESLTFDLVDGEIYEVDPNANSVTVTIDDGGPVAAEPPVVSFEAVPATVSEEDLAPSMEFRFTVTGDMPEGGVLANFDTLGDNDIIRFTEQFATTPEAEFINVDLEVFDPATGRIGWRITEPEGIVRVFFFNDLIEEGTMAFDFQLAEGEGYTVDPVQNATLFTITDDNGGPGVGPSVGLSVSQTELAEGDPFTATFNVTGDIPADGVEVLVQSSIFGALGQFDLADLGNITTTGIQGLPSVGDGGGSSFFVTIIEPTATISLSVFDDILAEEPLEMPFNLANGEMYEVDPNAPGVTVTISDEPQPAGPTVGIALDRSDVVEGETVTLTITVDGDIPAEGLTVLVNDVTSAQSQARSLTEFDVANIQTTGLAAPPTPAEGDSGFFATLVAPTATITLPVFDEGADEDESLESFTFDLIDGEAYEVDPAAGSVTLNISDVRACVPPMTMVQTTHDFGQDLATLLSTAASRKAPIAFSTMGMTGK